MRAFGVSAGCLLFAALTLVVVNAFRVQAKQTKAEDEQQIRLLIAAHAIASQHGDLQGLANVYHDDADVRYSDGTILHGRAELERRYRQALSNDPQAVNHSHPTETIRIRFLRPDIAFVDVESVSGGGADEPVERTPLFVVFTKELGHWGVAVQRSGVALK